MARPKKTADYLKELQDKGYRRYDELFNLYDRWKKKHSIKAISDFLDLIWIEKYNIKTK